MSMGSHFAEFHYLEHVCFFLCLDIEILVHALDCSDGIVEVLLKEFQRKNQEGLNCL